MVFPYYPRPEEDEQEPAEEQQPEESQPPIPSYLYDVFAYMGEDVSLLFPPKPTSDEGYVTPGKPHTLPSGPTTHPDPPIPNDIVAVVQPPTISGPSYVMPGVALDPSTETSPGDQSTGQDRAGSSHAEETSVQADPPDIAESGDDFGPYYNWIPGVSVDRQSAHSNLDVFLVQRDIETRPLIFQHCFQHSSSRREALECIYAFPPDFDEGELAHLEQYADQKAQDLLAGRGGDSDGENEGDSIGIGSEYGLLQEYEEVLESKYGIIIKWGRGAYSTNRLQQLQNLEKAIAYIVNYLAQEVYGDEHTALEVFKSHFGETNFSQYDDYRQSNFIKLQIYLGANSETGDKGYGLVPLDKRYSKEKLRSMYLGSAVDISTIVHEVGHVIDRSRGFIAYLTELVPDDRKPSQEISRIANETANIGEEFIEEYPDEYGHYTAAYFEFNLDSMVQRQIIEGFVAKQYFIQELWADLFATAVLDPAVSGQPFYVRSIGDDKIKRPEPEEGEKEPAAFPGTKFFEDFNSPDPSSDRHFYRCSDEGITCVTMPVMWEATRRARVAREYLRRVFRELLSTEGEDK